MKPDLRFIRLICSINLALLVAVASPALAGIVDVPLEPFLFETNCSTTSKNGFVSFEIDKNANILVKLPGVAEVHIDYEADGFFRVDYATVSAKYEIDPKFLTGYTLSKGRGKLKLNMRRTINWSDKTFPLLMLSGSGKFTIRKLEVVTVSALSDYRTEKNSAFFWRPETLRSSLMNFITPVYWNVSRKILLTNILGAAFIATITALFLFCLIRRKNVMKYLPGVSLFFALVFGAHFIVRFIPMLNGGFYLSGDEKIKRYYPLPELGQLVVSAKEKTWPADKVFVMAGDNDWFAKKAICFNIAPVTCAYSQKRRTCCFGLLKWEFLFTVPEADVIVYYNSNEPLPADFAKVYELNKNVFIARKR